MGGQQGYNYSAQFQQQQPQQQYAAWNQQPQSPGSQPQFQPSSSFGQQLSSHLNAVASSGYMSPGAMGGPGYQQQQQFTGYPQQSYNQTGYQQQQQPSGYQNYGGVDSQQLQPQYLPEFDPYASIAQGWNGTNPNQQPPSNIGSVTSTTPQSDRLHPREFTRKYKAELEAWDSYTWKQMQNTFDALKGAWERRMRDLEGRTRQISTSWGYNAQQEMAQYQQLLKDAETNFSSVAASSFQMKEVLQGYRQSTDFASKRRVREAMNAALQSLPDWPPLNY